MTKPEVVICTNIYNRYNTLNSYLESFSRSLLINPIKHEMIFVVNEDNNWNHCEAKSILQRMLDDVYEKQGVNATVLDVSNLGLMGYNIGLEIGRMYECPVLCCNDDVVFPSNWSNLLTLPKKATRINETTQLPEEKAIKPESIGVIGPCYVEPGCMKHQKYDENRKNYDWVDYIVGHCQLVTTNAIKKGFTYEPEICTKFGPYDVYQSMWMCSHELNTLVNREVCFDFPNSKESHFHQGNDQKFNGILGNCWNTMDSNLTAYQNKHKQKWGYNKWYFE